MVSLNDCNHITLGAILIRLYADELIVELPEGSTKRQEIFSFLNASEPSEDYEEQGQKTISVFWDY